MVKSGLDFFYFEILRAPSEWLLPSEKKVCPERLNWPSRLACISENDNFKTRDFIPLIEKVLDGVILKLGSAIKTNVTAKNAAEINYKWDTHNESISEI